MNGGAYFGLFLKALINTAGKIKKIFKSGSKARLFIRKAGFVAIPLAVAVTARILIETHAYIGVLPKAAAASVVIVGTSGLIYWCIRIRKKLESSPAKGFVEKAVVSFSRWSDKAQGERFKREHVLKMGVALVTALVVLTTDYFSLLTITLWFSLTAGRNWTSDQINFLLERNRQKRLFPGSRLERFSERAKRVRADKMSNCVFFTGLALPVMICAKLLSDVISAETGLTGYGGFFTDFVVVGIVGGGYTYLQRTLRAKPGGDKEDALLDAFVRGFLSTGITIGIFAILGYFGLSDLSPSLRSSFNFILVRKVILELLVIWVDVRMFIRRWAEDATKSGSDMFGVGSDPGGIVPGSTPADGAADDGHAQILPGESPASEVVRYEAQRQIPPTGAVFDGNTGGIAGEDAGFPFLITSAVASAKGDMPGSKISGEGASARPRSIGHSGASSAVSVENLISEFIKLNKSPSSPLLEKKTLIVGIDTSWVPELQRALGPFNRLLRELEKMPAKMNVNNVKIVAGENSRVLKDKIFAYMNNSETPVLMPNVLLIGEFGKGEDLSGELYESFKGSSEEQSAHFAKIILLEEGMDYRDIDMISILKLALEKYRGAYLRNEGNFFYLELPGALEEGLTINVLYDRYLERCEFLMRA